MLRNIEMQTGKAFFVDYLRPTQSQLSFGKLQVEISKKVLFSVRKCSGMFYAFHNSIGTIQPIEDKKKTSTKTRTFLKKAQNHLGVSL